MRRPTLITIVLLFVVIAVAAAYQLVLATRGGERYPGPVPGTPFPTVASSP